MDYIYLGDKLTDEQYKNKPCAAVKKKDKTGRKDICIRGKNGNMLIEFESGVQCVVLARRLKKTTLMQKIFKQ